MILSLHSKSIGEFNYIPTPTDPLADLGKPHCSFRGLEIYSSVGGFFSEVSVTKEIPRDLLKGLKIIFDVKSPIALQESKKCDGWYHKFYKVAWIRTGGGRTQSDIRRSLLHEIGHYAWANLSEKKRESFVLHTHKCVSLSSRIMKGRNDWMDEEERFADGFALAYLPGKKHKLSKRERWVVSECLAALGITKKNENLGS